MKRLLLPLLLLASPAFAATNDFTGTASTALATYDAAWAATSGNDGITDANLNGSGKLRTGSFKFSDGYRTDGDQNSHSIVTIAAGDITPASAQIFAAVRRGAANRGYDVEVSSSTSAQTNMDTVKMRRNGSFMENFTISSPINNATTAIVIEVYVTNTVDLVAIVNGVTYTSTGSGGNDHSGAAVLTGGGPGLSLWLNSSTLTFGVIDSWSDGVSASSPVPLLMQQQSMNVANDDKYQLVANSRK